MVKNPLPKLLSYVLKAISKQRPERELLGRSVQFSRPIALYGTPFVSVVRRSDIRLGERVTLCSESRFTALCVNHLVMLRTLLTHRQIVSNDYIWGTP